LQIVPFVDWMELPSVVLGPAGFRTAVRQVTPADGYEALASANSQNAV
jgi:hypothetical protein